MALSGQKVPRADDNKSISDSSRPSVESSRRSKLYQFMTVGQNVASRDNEDFSAGSLALDITSAFARRTTAHGLSSFYWARGKQTAY